MVLPNLVIFKLYSYGVLGALIIICGAVMFVTWPSTFKNILHKQMQITPGSQAFTLWRDTPIPMYMSFYFHNWTNPHELKTNKPKFEQMGPYRFNVDEKKTDIVFNDNGTITFKIARKWFFDPENSNGTLDDIVTTLNGVAVSAANTAKDWSVFMTSPLSMTIKTTGQKIFIQKKVGDVLFFGYNDPLIDVAGTLPSFVGVDIPFDKFAWFYKRNESSDFEGVLNMDTGVNDIYRLGKLHNWNYRNVSNFYDEPCGMINGSAGELFPPNQTKDRPIEFFTPDLCRSLSLPFDREEEVYGVKGYRYAATQYSFDNGTHDPTNECFCDGMCSPSGVLNVTSCRYGAPGFISFPHYYLADQYYSRRVEGMVPDPNRHTLYITLEPETGIPLDVAARFQINLLLTAIDRISLFKDVPTIYFPMMWFEQRGTITKLLAWQVKAALSLPFIGQIISLLLMIGGLIMFTYNLYRILTFNKRTQITIMDLKEEPTTKPLIHGPNVQIIHMQELLPKGNDILKAS